MPNSDSNNKTISIEEAKAKLEYFLEKLQQSNEAQQPLDEETYMEALNNFKQLTELIERLSQKES